jgi:hypothetical protein
MAATQTVIGLRWPERSGDLGLAPEARLRLRLRLTATGWSCAAGLTPGDWVRCGCSLGRLGRACGWWLGDWVRYGNLRYGERYALAARITGYDSQTLMNFAYVTSRFEISRRREKLSFSHHVEVASLPKPDQDRWLDVATEERLSVRELRKRVRPGLRSPRGVAVLAPQEHVRPARGRNSDTPTGVVCPSCGHHFEA